MTGTLRSKTLTIAIDRPPQDICSFVCDLNNLPRWARTFCRTVKRNGEKWTIETPQGPMKIRLCPPNTSGVLDHYVCPASGAEVYVPMRVVPNGRGSEVIFTIFQQPGMPDENFAADQALVAQDLSSLKDVLEQRRD